MKETNRNRANVAKRKARQRKLRNRRIALTVCLMLVVMVASIGGTVAWLTAQTTPVTNTFTYGDINIALAETTGNDYKIIPGVNIHKNPKVTVNAGSEACWLFVKVDATGNFADNKVAYQIADGWTQVDNVTGVYYQEVDATGNAAATFQVLKGNETHTDGVITVSENLTKDDIKNITQDQRPTLTFTAYAVQKDGIDNVASAWAKLNVTPGATPNIPNP